MWSKPAPPSFSGSATPVRPNSAAFVKRSRGKWPVSSSSRARGLTSASANSRTDFCSSNCSSVSSKFTRNPGGFKSARSQSQLLLIETVLIQIFTRYIIFRHFMCSNLALVRIQRVLDARHGFGFQRLPFLQQFAHALGIGLVLHADALQVTDAAAPRILFHVV